MRSDRDLSGIPDPRDIGDATVTLAFERDGAVTAFALLGQAGNVSVTMAAGE